MRDVEELVADHIAHQRAGTASLSKLKLLVPSIAAFFTPLPLHDAFVWQDARRRISYRRFVPPSFNDIRLVLNTAQAMALVRQPGPIELVTFDGDVTLYNDGESLLPENPVISRILALMSRGTRIGIVTAAGYTEARRYYERLHGLLDAIALSPVLSAAQKQNLVVMGGESNYCFALEPSAPDLLRFVPRKDWQLDEMAAWADADIVLLLDTAELALRDVVTALRLERATSIVRKDRAVGIAPADPSTRIPRESLEEAVLATQKILEVSEVGRRVPFCAFNGGNDVFVDIGDKSWGVLACQRFFGRMEAAATGGTSTSSSALPSTSPPTSSSALAIATASSSALDSAPDLLPTATSPPPQPDGSSAAAAPQPPSGPRIPASRTLHVGDQFLSAGANDFKARLACTTAWIASPAETVSLLDEIAELEEAVARKTR